MEYNYFEEIFVNRIFNCKNMDEVNKVIDKEQHAVLMKSYDTELVIFIILVKDNTYYKNVGVYFNLRNKEMEVVLANSRDVYDFDDSFVGVKLQDNGKVIVEHINGIYEIELLYGYPPGDTYAMNIENGGFGGGSNWEKGALGLL